MTFDEILDAYPQSKKESIQAALAYEFYLNDPQTVQPSALQTQIYFTLK